MTRLFFLLLLCGLAAAAADLTGKWSGSFDISDGEGNTNASQAYMNLKQNGSEVTGTAGPDSERQWPIKNGKLEGNKLTFEVNSDNGGKLQFDLIYEGESIRGEVQGQNPEGRRMSAKLNLKRAE